MSYAATITRPEWFEWGAACVDCTLQTLKIVRRGQGMRTSCGVTELDGQLRVRELLALHALLRHLLICKRHEAQPLASKRGRRRQRRPGVHGSRAVDMAASAVWRLVSWWLVRCEVYTRKYRAENPKPKLTRAENPR